MWKYSTSKVLNHCRAAPVFDAVKQTGYANKNALTDILADLLQEDENEESRMFKSYANS